MVCISLYSGSIPDIEHCKRSNISSIHLLHCKYWSYEILFLESYIYIVCLNRTDTLCLPILSLIHENLCMSHLTLGWNKFRKVPYVCQVLLMKNGIKINRLLFWNMKIHKLLWNVKINNLFWNVKINNLFWNVKINNLFWNVKIINSFWNKNQQFTLNPNSPCDFTYQSLLLN